MRHVVIAIQFIFSCNNRTPIRKYSNSFGIKFEVAIKHPDGAIPPSSLVHIYQVALCRECSCFCLAYNILHMWLLTLLNLTSVAYIDDSRKMRGLSQNKAVLGSCATLLISMIIGTLGTSFSESFIEIHIFSSKKIYLKMSSGNWQQFWPSLNALSHYHLWHIE